jgi:glycosyltransferase involved in cell wall biosynthesis
MKKLVVGIPTLNRADLLERCVRMLLTQMDHLEKIIIVDNGNQEIPYANLPMVEVIKNKTNLGVCTSWNQIIDKAFHQHNADWVLALNDDIALNQRQLSNSVHPLINHHYNKWLLVSPFYWAVWAMSKDGAKNLAYEPSKWFDENLFPGYYGDNDMQWRIENLDRSKLGLGISLFTPEICDNSMTLKQAPELRRGIAESGQYYFKKWGGGPNLEKFRRPFGRTD